MAGFDFDVEGAIKAGYTPDQVADYLASENDFDVGEARKAGYKTQDILNYLTTGAEPDQYKQLEDLQAKGIKFKATLEDGKLNITYPAVTKPVESIGGDVAPSSLEMETGVSPALDQITPTKSASVMGGTYPDPDGTVAAKSLPRSMLATEETPVNPVLAKIASEQYTGPSRPGPTIQRALEQASTPDQVADFTGRASTEYKMQPGIGERASRRIIDTLLVDVPKGVVGLGESAVGIASLTDWTRLLDPDKTGLVIRGMKAIGYDADQTKKILEQSYSDERKLSEKEYADTKGVIDSAMSLVTNPDVLLGKLVESAPMMVSVMGAAGRAYTAAKAAGVTDAVALAQAKLVASAGEGMLAAGSVAESIRRENPDEVAKMYWALPAGVATALISSLASKLPGGSFETMFVGRGAGALSGSAVVRGVKAGVVESQEEGFQSGAEQGFTNLGTNKPIEEGVGKAYGSGAVMGFAQGGGMAIAAGRAPTAADIADDTRTAALNKWATEGFSQPARETPASVAEKIVTAPTIDDALKASETILANAGAPIESKVYDLPAVGQLDGELSSAITKALGPDDSPIDQTATLALLEGRPDLSGDVDVTAAPDLETAALSSTVPVEFTPDPVGQERINTAIGGRLNADGVATLRVDGVSTPVQAIEISSLPAFGSPEAVAGRTSREGAAALRELSSLAGTKIEFYVDSPNLPDGFATPRAPNTIFVSDKPQRAAPFVVKHEFTHTIEKSGLQPALETAVEFGMTAEGWSMAEQRHGSTVPKDATPAERKTHLIKETAADIGGELWQQPKFVNRVMNEIEVRHGKGVVKEVMSTFIQSIQRAVQKVYALFPNKQDPVAAKMVSNLNTVETILAKMYADRFGSTAAASLKAQTDAISAQGQVSLPEARAGPEMLAVNAKQQEANAALRAAKSDADFIAAEKLVEEAENMRLGKTEIDTLANEAATSPLNDLAEPTAAQKEAGNYKVGKIEFQGLPISIENPEGSIRSGVSQNGNKWSNKMAAHYGYVPGSVGADSTESKRQNVDVFVGKDHLSKNVFVIDQVNKDRSFDEHKAMLAYSSEQKAREGYLLHYPKNWKGLGAITRMSMTQFKDWVKNPENTTKPASPTVKYSPKETIPDWVGSTKTTMTAADVDGAVTWTKDDEANYQRGLAKAKLAVGDEKTLIYSQLEQLGENRKLAYTTGTDTSGRQAERAFGQRRVQTDVQLSPKSYPESAIKVLESASPKKDFSVDEVGQYFDKLHGPRADYSDPKARARAMKQARSEFAYQIKTQNTGLDWYAGDIEQAFEVTEKVIPYLAEGRQRMLFSVIAGIHSQQTKVVQNWPDAAESYQHYLRDETLPETDPNTGGYWATSSGPNKARQIGMVNAMIADLGEDGFIDFMFTEHTIPELNDARGQYGNMGRDVPGKAAETALGVMMFGPKVGEFIKNINGLDGVTVDKWMTRTFNRWFGRMTDETGKLIDEPTEPERRVIKSMINEIAAENSTSPQSVQAAFWYFEQSVFKQLGAGGDARGFSYAAKEFYKRETGDDYVGEQLPERGGGRDRQDGGRLDQDIAFSPKQSVNFEVAPDPNDEKASGRWKALTADQRLAISERVARETIPTYLESVGAKGDIVSQIGSYLDETNPSFALNVEDGDASQIAKDLGFSLSQDSMVVMGAEPFDGSNPTGAVRITLGPKTLDEIATIYNTLRDKNIQGQSYSNGVMTVLNFSPLSTKDLADQIADKLKGEYDVVFHDIHTSFPTKAEYDYASETGNPRRNEGLARLRQNIVRKRIASAIESEFANLNPEATRRAVGESVRDAGRVRGGARSLAGNSRPYQGNGGTSLQGLPRQVEVDGNVVDFQAFAPAQRAARAYARSAGISYKPPTTYVRVDKARATRIANAFTAMKHEPNNPEVRLAYEAMIGETLDQYREILKTGLKVEFIDYAKTGDPYGNSRNAILDVVKNNHLWVFSTKDGFGSSDMDVSDNPLLAATEFEFAGKPALANDIFRVVHDYFGHIKEGVGFRADGEENAWRAHSAMYSPLARRAMTNETRGQNSWVNFGPEAEFNRTASGADTIYADQKLGLLPEWVSEEGATDLQFSRKQQDTKEFKRWAKNLPVIHHDDTGSYEGGSAVFEGFHGTTHTGIERINPDPTTGSGTGYLGKGFYVTTTQEDASANYAGEGPDLTERIGRNSEQLYDQYDEDNYAADEMLRELADNKTLAPKELVDAYDRELSEERFAELKEKFRDSAVMLAARQNLKGESDGLVMPIYVRLENPFDIRPNGLDLTYEQEYDDDGPVGEPTGSAVDLIEVVRGIGEQYGAETDNFINWIWENAIDGSVSAHEVFNAASKEFYDAYDDGGELLSTGGLMVIIAKELGYDGIIMDANLAFGRRKGFGGAWVKGMKGVSNGTLHLMPFGPNQVKSAVGNSGEFSLTDPRIQFSPKSETPFYSALTKAVEDSKTNSAPADQWAATIRKMPGVKPEELKWSGVEEWLLGKGGKVSKAELVEYLRSNEIQVQEVILGEDAGTNQKFIDEYVEGRREEYQREREEAEHRYNESDESGGHYVNEETNDEGETVWELKHINYDPQESFETEDEAQAEADSRNDDERDEAFNEWSREYPGFDEDQAIQDAEDELENDSDTPRVKFDQWQSKGGDRETYREVLLTLPTGVKEEDRGTAYERDNATDFQSSHFDQPNILAHARLKETTDADGARVLLIEEIQSDWAQAGRKKGFKEKAMSPSETGEIIRERRELIRLRSSIPRDSGEWHALDVQINILEERLAGRAGVANAPFVQSTASWAMLAFKRMVRYAAEKDIDKLVWTTGQQQVDRYTHALRKAVDKLEWNKTEQGIHLIGYKDGRKVVDTTEKENALSDSIGKSMADGIIADPNQSGVIKDQNIKVSDTGMAGFYDNILPKEVNKYVKKWGVKVEDVPMDRTAARPENLRYQVQDTRGSSYPGKTEWYVKDIYNSGSNLGTFKSIGQARAYAELMNAKETPKVFTQMGITITPEMKESVLAGQPLFSPKVDPDERFGGISIKKGAEMIAAMPESERDEIEFQNLPGGWAAHNYFEAKKLVPKPTDKLKKVTERNSNTLHQDNDYVINVDGELYSVTKQEDPDDDENEEAFVYSFERMDSRTHEGENTMVSDVPELISEIRKFAKKGAGDLKQSPKSKPNISVPTETKAQGFQRKMQEKDNRFKVVQKWLTDNGVALSESANVYDAMKLHPGRVATRFEDFRKEVFAPIVKDLEKTGFTLRDAETYLHAKHAKERNAQVALVNPLKPDGGSGMSNAAATAILNGMTDPAFIAITKRLQKITDDSLALLLKSGRLDADAVKAMKTAYANYVPLKGGDEVVQTGTGKGFDVKHKMKRAMGHDFRDEHIIENILRDHERAIMTAEKQRVGQTLLQFAIEADDPDLITIGKPVKRAVMTNQPVFEIRYQGGTTSSTTDLASARAAMAHQIATTKLNPKDFQIVKTTNPLVQYQASPMMAENEAGVYLNGKLVRMQIVDPMSSRSYKNLGADHLVGVLRVAREITAWQSKAYTGYNPYFFVKNVVRDMTEGVMNLTGDYGAVTMAKVVAHYPMAFASLLKYAATGKATQDIRDYRADGGSTGAAYLGDLERVGEDVRNFYNEYAGVADTARREGGFAASKVAASKTIGAMVHFLEVANQAGENAMRLATYQTLREQGVSRSKSAIAAKDVTLNFNRKGEVGAAGGALWLFFNPAVQGTARLVQTMFLSEHRAQAWAMASAMGFLFYAMAKANDDEDKKRWKETPDFDKAHNLIIPAGKHQVKIPIPYGYGFFGAMGTAAYEASQGKDPKKLAYLLANSFVESFSPIGNPLGHNPEYAGLAQIVPFTPLKIGAEIGVNRSGLGGTIYPDRQMEGKPDSSTMFHGTRGTIWDKIASGANRATGGNAAVAGWADVHPDVLKSLWGTMTGGPGRVFADIENTAAIKMGGGELTTQETPFKRDFVREARIGDTRKAFWDAHKEVESAQGEFSTAKKNLEQLYRGTDGAAQKEGYDILQDVVEKQRALIGLGSAMNAYTKAVGETRNQIDAVMADKTLTLGERRIKAKAMEVEEQRYYDDFIKLFDVQSKMRDEEARARKKREG